MMFEKETPTAKIFLAVLPMIFLTRTFPMALQAGLILGAAFALAAFFFAFFSGWFPPRLLRFAYMIGLAALAQVLFHAHESLALGVLSLYLLMPEGIFAGNKKEAARAALYAVLFAGLLAFLGAFQDVLGVRFHVGAFQLPAGSFLLLFMAAALWQKPRVEIQAPHHAALQTVEGEKL
ncbi:MAG TPA: hypothetical protein VL688_08105 [Verrucomicrobiae bacterium]|nr:hypothetical protein [Verrucomicrobiae bacterium]